jgi:UPF0755 protein
VSGRTPEEREAARLERERRRAAKEGRPMPPAPAPAPSQPAPQPQAPMRPRRPEPQPPQSQPQAPVVLEPIPGKPTAPTGDVAEMSEHVGKNHQASDPPTGEWETGTGEHETEPVIGEWATETGEWEADADPDEAAAGTRRVSALHRRGRGSRETRPPRPARGAAAQAPKHPRSWRSRAGALVAIVLAAALVWFLISLFQPFTGSGGTPVKVTIPAHLSSRQVGDLLAKDGVVSSGFFFELRATLGGDRSKLRSGTYTLRKGESYGDVLTKLTTPPPAARVSELTVIEGTTRASLSKLLKKQGVKGNYLTESRSSKLLSPARYGAPRSTPSLEGFLFPDTFQLREPITASALINDQLAQFRRRFRAVNLSAARHARLTAYDVLTIASLVQGEARTAGDRAKIASVIYNRLRDKMPLQIDATVRYATGNFTKPITVSELHSHSPWNTYTHSGLPRTPINSPGLAAIQAAAHPAHTNYLFFVVKPCGNGAHAFASTYAQFQVLETRYNTARTKRGGNSPEFCR